MEIDNQGYRITRQLYKGFEIVIKAKEHRGMKGLCVSNNKVIFNQDFLFIDPDKLLKRMCDKVDMYLAGVWIPKKLRETKS